MKIKGQYRSIKCLIYNVALKIILNKLLSVVVTFICRSALMIAAGNGQIGMLRLLLRYDADITLKDIKGWSADDYAVMNGHHP